MQRSITTLIPNINDAHVTYKIVGFDRMSFVNDIANTVPEDGSYSIRTLCFETDGLQANGWLTVQMREELKLGGILVHRLRSIRGIVSVQEVQ